jgi:F0F1-type ATP synthase assembly protein I
MVGLASGLGCSVVTSFLIFIGAGVLLDRWLGIEPIGVLVGLVLGMIAAGYSFYELVKLSGRKRGANGPGRRTGGENGEAPLR